MLHLASLLLVLAAPEWRNYEVYEPAIERCFVVDPAAQELKYNHVSSMVWFKGQWFCLWNGNTTPAEGKPGQLDYMSTSTDGMHWTPPVPAFSDPGQSHNPVPCPKGYQWQPNLIVVGDELWAFWDQKSSDTHEGCYFSRLDAPDGKWRNRLLLWDGAVTAEKGHPKALVNGKRLRPFPTQNPHILRSGRILQPVTLMGPKAQDAPDGLDNWWVNEKYSSVIYSDDRGKTWHASPGAIMPGRSWGQWEPTVWEQPDGTVMMFARFNDPRTEKEGGPGATECMLWSRSEDGGETWSPHKPVSIETVVSRPYVVPGGGDRYLMAHNDWHAGRFCSDRMNLALFFTRGPGLDFAAGPGFSAQEQIVAYPQMFIHENALHISYTQGTALRGIKAIRIHPLPDPDRYYLFPRTNRPWFGPPEQKDGSFRFHGIEHLETRAPVEPGAEAFSLAAMIRTTERGVLLDTRGPSGGFVWALTSVDAAGGGVVPFVHLGSPEGNIRSKLIVPFGAWVYCGVTVDREAGRVTFAVGGKTEIVTIASDTKSLGGTTGYIGLKRIKSSGLAGFQGQMKGLAFFQGMAFSAEQHQALAATDGEFASGVSEDPAFVLTAHKPLEEQAFRIRESKPAARRIQLTNGKVALEITGDASAGIDLDQNDRAKGDLVELEFKARVPKGPDAVLCTVGDADHPARVVLRGEIVRLELSGKALELGRVANPSSDWCSVSLRSGGGKTAVRMNGGAEHTVPHEAQATWVYLGDGYPDGKADPARRVLIDTASVRSRVVRP